jgi:hypothetical protein
MFCKLVLRIYNNNPAEEKIFIIFKITQHYFQQVELAVWDVSAHVCHIQLGLLVELCYPG